MGVMINIAAMANIESTQNIATILSLEWTSGSTVDAARLSR